MTLEFNVGPFVPPPTSHDKYGDPHSSCTRTQRGPSTFCTLAPARLFKTSRFQDPAVKRMLSKLQNIDKAALPQDELEEVMDGAPRSPGTCSPPQGWLAEGKPDRLGRREVVGQGYSFLWGRRERGWWEDASDRPAPPSRWG